MARKLLKDLALNARNRLMNRQGGSLKKKSLYSPNVKFRIISNEDAEFNEKAMSLKEEDMLSPLKKLINQQIYHSLSPTQKEKYLLETIDKYAKFRARMSVDDDRKAL